MRGVTVAAIAIVVGALGGCGGGDEPPPEPPATATAGCDWRAAELDDGPVQRYVDAVNAGDLDRLAAAFARDAEVVDVGRSIDGAAAIRSWAEAEVIGGRLTVIDCESSGSGADLLVRFAADGGDGGFEARYRFTVDGDLITRAELTYA